MADIRIVKFINGEELIGDFKNKGDYVQLTDVATIMLVPDQTQRRASIAMIPYMQYADQKTFDFHVNCVMTTAKPVLELMNQYNQIFGSGLVVAKHL